MNLYNLSTLFFAFSTFLLGLIIFLKRSDEIGKTWFAFSIAAGIWATGYSFQINNEASYEKALLASRIADAAAIFIPATWLRFIYSFLGLKTRRSLFVPIYLFCFILLLSTPTNLFIPGLKNKSHLGFTHFVAGGPFFHLFTIFFFSIIGFSFFKILRAIGREDLSKERKTHIRDLLIASGIGYLGGSTAFLPVYDINLPILWGCLLLPLFPFLTAFAITRHRLLDIEEMAQVAQRDKLAAIGLLSASINHEIRSPLFVIKGHAETLLEGMEKGAYKSLPEEERQKRIELALKKTIEQSERVVEITKRLTDFSKPAADASVTEPVNLNEVMDNVLSFVDHGLKVDNIDVQKSVSPDLTLHGNRKELEQIFLNLLINASQAMEKRTGKIKIEAHGGREGVNGKWKKVEIQVSDTGPGIPPDQLSKIFEPFYTTKESGTGLGLYVTKQLVERNKGRISVESKLGQGTTFVLEFRRAG